MKSKASTKSTREKVQTIAELYLDQHNLRKHNPRNIGMLVDSLQAVGAARSIVIDEDNTVLAGNGVLEAAGEAGITKLQVVEADGETVIAVRRRGLTAAQKQQLAIYDNRVAELATWDAEALQALQQSGEDLSAYFRDNELDELLRGINLEPSDDEDFDADSEAAKVAEPKTKMGDLYLLGRHRLLCGDSTDADAVSKLLGGSRPHLMVTDPPYGVEYNADWRNHALRADGTPIASRAIGKVINDDKADWREAWALFPGDVAYVWHASVRSPEVAESLAACNFERRNLIVWAKSNFAIGRGHYHHMHEPCWYVVKKGSTGHWEGDRKQTTLWEIAKPVKSETGHSAQKPLECMLRPIKNNSRRGDAVYDPFLGSGTTLIACEQAGRICYGLELSPVYCDVIVSRWEKLTGQTATIQGALGGETPTRTLQHSAR